VFRQGQRQCPPECRRRRKEAEFWQEIRRLAVRFTSATALALADIALQLAFCPDCAMIPGTDMRSHRVTLSEPLSRVVDTQVKNGRFKDFSAAVQEALWNFFVDAKSPFDEYGVTPEEVERSARRELAAIKRDRKAGRLKAWTP